MRRLAFLAVCAIPLGSACSLAAAVSSIPSADFARAPDIAAPVLSPSGRALAYVVPGAEGKPVVVLHDLETQKVRAVLGGAAGTFRVQRCDFKNDDRLLCRFYGTTREMGVPYWVSRLVAVDAAGGGEPKVLLQNGRAGAAQFQDQILHWLPDDPRHVLIALDDDENVFPGVFRLDVYSGRSERVLREREPVVSWLADRQGVVRFGYGFRDSRSQGALYVARDGEDAPWRTLLKFRRFDGTIFRPLGFGAHPNSLLVVAPHNGREAIWEMDLSERADFQLVFSHAEVDVGSAMVWTEDGRVVGFDYETDRLQRHYVDAEAAAVQRGIDGALPQTINTVLGTSRDRKRLLVAAASDVRPTRYHLLDLERHKLLTIGSENRALDGAVLAPMKPVRIAGPDGLELPGYLTLPPGRESRGLPAIVLPHGGPYARDSWGYDPLVQLLANRGHAVLQVNFRGSTGYGEAWYEAGFQGWGTVMHQDITAAARWLLAQGIADPKRLCIVGWSYGGYAALLGASKEPRLYRCAVSVAGVSDPLEWQYDNSAYYGGRAAAQLSTGSGAADLAAVSPERNAARIEVPVLLVHGEDDTQVRVDHSKAMAKALARAGKAHELVIIRDGDHALSRPEWRLELYSKLERFLAAHLGGVASTE